MMDGDDSYAEVVDLGHALDAVVAELDRIRRESEATNRQLLLRNRELAATAAIAQVTFTGQLDLAETLERALQIILEVTGLAAGWILLLPEEGREPVMTSSAGLPQDAVVALTRFRSSECECECHKTLDSRCPRVIHPLHTGCLVRGLDLEEERVPACHITVPLLARSKVLGVINLASEDPAHFGEQEMALLGAIGRQLGVAIENAYLLDELRHRDALRGQMLEQIIAAQEDERRHIARALHDQTGQALTSILVWLRALEAEADGSSGLTISAHHLQELKAIVADTLDGVRKLALDLRPSVLDDLGLVPAVQRIVRTYQDRHQLVIDMHTAGLEGERLPPSVETALYRIVLEALTNVVQHAGAECVSLLLEARWTEPSSVVAILEDDGCGFEVGSLVRGQMDERWLGLSGMRERAELLGGRLTIESSPGAGTTVFVEVPL
jgi:signal transduction histidine kinase